MRSWICVCDKGGSVIGEIDRIMEEERDMIERSKEFGYWGYGLVKLKDKRTCICWVRIRFGYDSVC